MGRELRGKGKGRSQMYEDRFPHTSDFSLLLPFPFVRLSCRRQNGRSSSPSASPNSSKSPPPPSEGGALFGRAGLDARGIPSPPPPPRPPRRMTSCALISVTYRVWFSLSCH